MSKSNKELREKIIIKNYTNSSLDLLLPYLSRMVPSCKEDFPCGFIIDINNQEYAIGCYKNKQSKGIVITDGKKG